MLKVCLLFMALLLSNNVFAIEEPSFTTVLKNEDFEIRHYQKMVVAETRVNGDMDNASSKGFRRLAGYIFGDNTASSGDKQKIAMTAPVILEAEQADITQGDSYWVRFVMPSEYELDSLPKPNKSHVNLRALPEQRFAVIRFSGFSNEKKVTEKLQALRNWMNTENLEGKGEPILARYNPPWTPPFMRRNELLIAIEVPLQQGS